MSDARLVLDPEQSLPLARAQQASFHHDLVVKAQGLLHSHPILVIGMDGNPFCKKARRLLEGASIPFHYWAMGGYMSQWKPRLAIKMWSGWPTFPQVFVNGKLLGGFSELSQSYERGELRELVGA